MSRNRSSSTPAEAGFTADVVDGPRSGRRAGWSRPVTRPDPCRRGRAAERCVEPPAGGRLTRPRRSAVQRRGGVGALQATPRSCRTGLNSRSVDVGEQRASPRASWACRRRWGAGEYPVNTCGEPTGDRRVVEHGEAARRVPRRWTREREIAEGEHLAVLGPVADLDRWLVRVGRVRDHAAPVRVWTSGSACQWSACRCVVTNVPTGCPDHLDQPDPSSAASMASPGPCWRSATGRRCCRSGPPISVTVRPSIHQCPAGRRLNLPGKSPGN